METLKKLSLKEHQYLITPHLYKDEDQIIIKKENANRISNKNVDKMDEKKAEENLYEYMCSDLPLYQDKIKRDKTLYKEEFSKFLNVFIPKFNEFLEMPSTNYKNLKEVFVFLAHLSHIYPKELAFLPAQLKQLLEHSYAIIHPEIRLAIIEAFNLIRKKNLIEPIE